MSSTSNKIAQKLYKSFANNLPTEDKNACNKSQDSQEVLHKISMSVRPSAKKILQHEKKYVKSLNRTSNTGHKNALKMTCKICMNLLKSGLSTK